jgi:hypothetical protein
MAEREETCRFVRLLPDGTPVMLIDGVEREVEIEGVEIPQPPPQSYVELFNERLLRSGRPLRCIVRAELPAGRLRATVLYFGWQDKSGDVWVDLAETIRDLMGNANDNADDRLRNN